MRAGGHHPQDAARNGRALSACETAVNLVREGPPRRADDRSRSGQRVAFSSQAQRSDAWDTVGAVEPTPRIPSVSELLWPTLRAVREIGDSGRSRRSSKR